MTKNARLLKTITKFIDSAERLHEMKSIKISVLIFIVLILSGIVPATALTLMERHASWHSGVSDMFVNANDVSTNSKIAIVGASGVQVNYTAVVYPEYTGTAYRVSNNESFSVINTGAGYGHSPDVITWLISDTQTDRFKENYKGVFSFNFSNASIPANAVFTSATLRTLIYQLHPNTLGNTRYTITQLNPPDQTSLNWSAYPYRYYNNTPLSDWIDQPVSEVNEEINYTFNAIGLTYLQETTSKSRPANLSIRSSWDTSNSFNGTWGNANETGIDAYGMTGVSTVRPYMALNYYVITSASNNSGIAIFRPSTGWWYFDYNIDGAVNNSFRYGNSADRIISGNWQGSNDGIAIFRPSTGYWYFDYNLDGIVNKSFRYGGGADQIIAGKWA
jgi:hypothetical protein